MAKEDIQKKIRSKNDIIDIEAILKDKEEQYNGTDDIFGMALLTFPMYISASRGMMFSAHLKQFTNLIHPEFPKVFTNYENVVGRHSTSIGNAKSNYRVIDKIAKFKTNPNHLYYLFVYDKENDKYDVIVKKLVEELTEKFGYAYNNDKMDSLKIGDKVNKGETLWKSTSYDEDNNYCYGMNVKCAYMVNNNTIEDAIEISESLAKRMTSVEPTTVKVPINDNDFLCNLYGNNKIYRGFPEIGEKIDGVILCAKRRIINDQILNDMKNSNLRSLSSLNDKLFYGSGKVIDIDIYSNKELEDIPANDYNEQIIEYLKNQRRFYDEVFKRCEKIINSGSKYSDDIGFIYKRAKDILDPDVKWKDNNSAFNNFIIEFVIEKESPVDIGSKLVGRFANKGVVSKIVPDDKMPFTKDGVRVDLIFNSLGVINRLNSAQLFEVSVNFIGDNLVKKFKEIESREEKEKMLFTFLSYFNERGMYDKVREFYNNLNEDGKDGFFEEIQKNGIYVNMPPAWEDKPIFDKLWELYDIFPWIKPYDLYIKKWGREIKIMRPMVVADQYIIKLKQTSKKNFSARSTGHLSQKGLPDKTDKAKYNQQLYSTTPIKIGKDESANLSIGVDSEVIAKMHLLYRSSVVGRREMGKLLVKNILKFDKFKVKKMYKNRNIEILNAYLKCMGARIIFPEDSVLCEIDTDTINTFRYKNELFVGTTKEFRDKLEKDYFKEKFNEKVIFDTEEGLNNQFNKFINHEKGKVGKGAYFWTDKDDK